MILSYTHAFDDFNWEFHLDFREAFGLYNQFNLEHEYDINDDEWSEEHDFIEYLKDVYRNEAYEECKEYMECLRELEEDRYREL